MIAHEVEALESKYDEVLLCPIEWHVWSLDKSCRVGTFKVQLRDQTAIKATNESQCLFKSDIEQRV